MGRNLITLLIFLALIALVTSFQIGKGRVWKKEVSYLASGGIGALRGLSMTNKYCEDTTRTIRRKTSVVRVGDVHIGSEYPIVKQTMTTTSTRDVDASIDQVMRIACEGGEMARLTVQGKKEADACMKIREGLWEKGYKTPLVADIHFAPAVALAVAEAFEKIRVNPGNFADGFKKFDDKVYDSREEFDKDLVEIEKLFVPLVQKCKELGRAMRIGTNHGSLSARVMSYWGDSPRGMVESAVEFANICRANDYHNFLFSMKASNPVVMVQAYRLLAAEMYKLGWNYPMHLGVTEAGEGEDGRMKSAIGIGTLLADGLGDTVRVSLTEDPEFELVPCQTLVKIGESLYNDDMFKDIPAWEETSRDFENFDKRRGDLPGQQEGDLVDVRGMMHRDGSVFSTVSLDDLKNPEQLYVNLGAKMVVGMPFKDVATTDSIYLPQVPALDDMASRKAIKRLQDVAVGVLADIDQLAANPLPNSVAIVTLESIASVDGGLPPLPEGAIRYALKCTGLEPVSAYEKALKNIDGKMTTMILEVPVTSSRVHASRRVFQILRDIGENGAKIPVVHSLAFENTPTKDELILRTGFEAGALLVDGMGDGVMVSIKNPKFDVSLDTMRQTSFNLLQGCRMRSTKTDFVSCPSCGRTLFDLQEVTEQIKEKTGHLPGVSIAIMGCIVNGPGEMADADFGYVGGAPGKVDLYVGKEVVKRGIPNADACDALVDLIKENGRWVDKSEDETDASAKKEEIVSA